MCRSGPGAGLAVFDYLRVGASLDDRVVEYVGHLHEHFVDPVVLDGNRYRVPAAPGYSITMRPDSLVRYRVPTGAAWAGAGATPGRGRVRGRSRMTRLSLTVTEKCVASLIRV